MEYDSHNQGGAEEIASDGLEALTLEQVTVLDLLSQGVTRGQVAAGRGTKTPEIDDLVDATAAQLGLESHGAVYALLKAKVIEPDAKERAAAAAKLRKLSPRQQEAVSILMSGNTYKQTAKVMRREEGTIKGYVTEINKVIGTRSLLELARVGYAAGLSGEEFETLVKAEETPVSRDNIEKFLSWMYPNRQLPSLDELTDDDLRALVQNIVKDAKKYGSSRGRKAADHMRPAISAAQALMEGKQIARIAEEQGRTDGSVHIGLTNLAATLGSRQYPDELIAKATTLRENEETAREVILGIRARLLGEKALAIDSFEYEKPYRLTPNLEAEAVTIINLAEEQMHESQIIRLLAGQDIVSPEASEQITEILAQLAKEGLVMAEGSGFYSKMPGLPEPRPASPDNGPPNSEAYPEDYTRRYLQEPAPAQALDEMISAAGLENSSRQRQARSRRR